MRRDAVLAAGLLFGALLACGGSRFVAYEPHSTRMSGKQIAEKAILIGPGDVGAVRDAGGLPAGTLTMRGNASLDSVSEDAAAVAAEVGGTHIMVGTWADETDTTAYVANKGYGSSWTVVPITRTEKVVKFTVIRVPFSGWSNLPRSLAPTPHY